MKMKEIIEIARKRNIPYKVGLSKADLIWSIQIKEGNSACFRRDDLCKGHGCLWQTDCVPSKDK